MTRGMEPATYYHASARDRRPRPALSGDIRADVAVIGGGFTGVNVALELAERGRSVVLLERHRVGWGATGRNGGQVTGSLSGDETLRRHLVPRIGAEAAADFVWDMRWRGHGIVEARVERYGIACDLRRGHLHAAWHPRDMADLRAFAGEADRRGMGDAVTLLDRTGLRERLDTPLYHGGLLNRRNLHLHPLDLCRGEARAAESRGVRIFEGTAVTALDPGPPATLRCDGGRVTAETVILAGGAYHGLERRALGGRLFPAALGNMATAPLSPDLARAINPENLAVYDTRFVLDYYRPSADGRLIFGGGANYSGRASADIARTLRPALERTFPQLKGIGIDFAWSGQAGIVPNRVPMLGRTAPTVWYAQGYSGHGIATSHIVAEIVAEAVAGTTGRFDHFASIPHARNPFGDRAGQGLLALGMLYHRLREAVRS